LVPSYSPSLLLSHWSSSALLVSSCMCST
jgi:hypothetical protein